MAANNPRRTLGSGSGFSISRARNAAGGAGSSAGAPRPASSFSPRNRGLVRNTAGTSGNTPFTPQGLGGTPTGNQTGTRRIDLPQMPDASEFEGNGIDFMRNLLMGEAGTMQDLENEQAQRLDQTEAALGGLIGRGVDRTGAFDELATSAELAGQQIQRETRNRVNMTEYGFRNDSAELADATAMGIERQINTQIQQINNDPNMSPQMKAAQIQRLEQGKLEAKSRAMTEAGTQFNSTMATLRTQGTQALQQGGQLAQQGRQIAGSLRTAGSNSLAAFASMVPQLHQMQVQSPRSMVSLFSGLTSLMDLASTRGGRSAANIATGLGGNSGPLNLSGRTGSRRPVSLFASGPGAYVPR